MMVVRKGEVNTPIAGATISDAASGYITEVTLLLGHKI